MKLGEDWKFVSVFFFQSHLFRLFEMRVSRSPESLLVQRAPPSHNLGGGGKELSEPLRRGAERTTPRDFPVKPLNWHN